MLPHFISCIRTLSVLAQLVSPFSAGNIRAIRPGDCVVAFSRQKIFELSAEIERMTNQKCSIIYGGLPPCELISEFRSDVMRLVKRIFGLNSSVQLVTTCLFSRDLIGEVWDPSHSTLHNSNSRQFAEYDIQWSDHGFEKPGRY